MSSPPPPNGVNTTTQYMGFGSFHSANVEDLIALPDNEYTPPQVPPFAAEVPTVTEFGAASKELFYIDPEWTFINHGAFGGALKGGVAIRRQYEELMESQILEFVDRRLLPLLVYSVRKLAAFLSCDPKDLVLVNNATFGLNAAVNTIEKGDVVMYLESEYGSVWKMMRERCQAVGADLNEVAMYDLPPSVLGSDTDITAYLADNIPKGCNVVVLDHVTSNSAYEMPIFSHILPMLKARGITRVVVDGAHAPLQLPLAFSQETTLPAVYVGNLHKWFCCPKSVGFMWVRKDYQHAIAPPIVSHGVGSGFLSQFIWDGTKDYGPALALPSIIDFWSRADPAAVRKYSSELLTKAIKMLSAAFGTEVVARRAPFMSLVQLPAILTPPNVTSVFVQDALHALKVEIPAKKIGPTLYLRVSCFIYNTMSDYERLRDAVLEVCEVVKKRPLESPTSDAAPKRVPNDDGCAQPSSGATKRRTSPLPLE